MDLVNQGMNKEEAIENTIKTLFTSNTTTMPVSEISLFSHVGSVRSFLH